MELDETEAFCAEPPGTAVSVFDLAGSAGAVADVAPDGPAAQAGIRANDVIISVNDKPAVSALETMDQVAEIRPGSEIPVVIMRDDKKITLHIAVQEYPATN